MGSSSLQVWGDGHSGVLLAVEQHWGHFQTPFPQLAACDTSPGSLGRWEDSHLGTVWGAVWGGRGGCGAVCAHLEHSARYRAALGAPAVQCHVLQLAGDQRMPAVPP